MCVCVGGGGGGGGAGEQRREISSPCFFVYFGAYF